MRPTTTGFDDKPAPRRWIENIEGVSNIGGVASNVEAFGCYGPQGVAGILPDLFREGKAVSEHAVTVVKCDDCVGFIKLKDPHRVCSRAQRGDDLRKEVG